MDMLGSLMGHGWLVKGTCIYLALVSLLLVPQIQREFIFMHRFSDYNAPEKYGFLPHVWRSFHIKTSDNVLVGATQFLPLSVYNEAMHKQGGNFSQPLSEQVYEDVLASDRPTVLHLHGNGATRLLSTRLQVARAVTEVLDCNFLSIDYRSFGNSERVTPSEQGLVLDARAAWDWLTQNKSLPAQQVAVWGHSLGSGVAAQLAAELAAANLTPRALILSAPFASLRSLMSTARLFNVFPLLGVFQAVPPVQEYLVGFLQTHFNTFQVLPNSTAPVLITQAADDANIPVYHSRALYSLLNRPQGDSIAPEHRAAVRLAPKSISLGSLGSYQEAKLPNGRRVVHLETTWGGHNGAESSQAMVRFVKDIMQV